MQSRILKVILLAAAAVRVGLLLASPAGAALTPDSEHYLALAGSLAEGRYVYEDEPELLRPPGYPLLVMLARTSGEAWYTLLAAAQIALSVALVYVVFLLGWTICGERVGLWAAGLQAVSPLSAAASLRVLTDEPYALLLGVTVLLLAHHFRTGAWWPLVSAAAVAAAGCYLRPAGMLLAAAAAVVLLLRPKRLARTGAFLALFAAILAPWIVRNGLRADFWQFSSTSTDAPYLYSGPVVLVEAEGLTFEQARRKMESLLVAEGGRDIQPPGRRERLKREVTLSVVGMYPGTYAKLHAKGCAAAWLPGATDVLELAGATSGQSGTLAVLREEGPRAAARHYFGDNTTAAVAAGALCLLWAARLLLAAVGVAKHFRPRMPAGQWLLLAVVALFLLAPGPAGHPRFRVPVEPLLSVVAGAGAVALLTWRQRRRSTPA